LKLLEADDWDGACEKFRASMNAEPSGGTALNLARCHERDGENASAWAEYTRAITLFRTNNDVDRAAFADEQAKRLEPLLSKLTIEVTPTPGLVVERDGIVVVEGAYGVPVAVDAGERTITASAEGYEPWTTTVTVGTNPDLYTVSVPALVKAPEPISPGPVGGDSGSSSEGLVIAGGILTGVGGAALIVGGILGGLVFSDKSKLDEECDEPDTNDGMMGCPQEVEDGTLSSAKTKATVSTVMFVGGGVLAAGGVALLIIGLTGDDSGSEMAVVPQIGPGHAGLTYTTSF
ncbi:MAG: hypothetical protein RIF41_15985, partial [Polyangiaceae bacterium]